MKLSAETVLRKDEGALWALTQDPGQHQRWDLRFTEIRYLLKAREGDPQRFAYVTRLGGGLRIEGWGTTVVERDGRGSSLRFGSRDPKSLIREGAGCWVYRRTDDGVLFRTVYDYQVRFGWVGRLIDGVAFRPLMEWATRWSFDRLRIWVDRGIEPEVSRQLWLLKVLARTALGAVWVLEGLVPKLWIVAPEELALVSQSGLVLGSPAFTLGLLGVVEMLGGLWLLSGKGERTSSLIAAISNLLIVAVVVWTDPLSLAGPYGGIVKNLGLWVCSVVVFVLSEIVPKADRANPKRQREET